MYVVVAELHGLCMQLMCWKYSDICVLKYYTQLANHTHTTLLLRNYQQILLLFDHDII